MGQFHENTCIRFIPRTNQQSYIQFQAKETGYISLVPGTQARFRFFLFGQIYNRVYCKWIYVNYLKLS